MNKLTILLGVVMLVNAGNCSHHGTSRNGQDSGNIQLALQSEKLRNHHELTNMKRDDDDAAPELTRILASGYANAYEVNLSSKIKQRYGIKPQNVWALASNPLSNAVIWANYTYTQPDISGIFSYDVDSGVNTSLKTGIRSLGVAVDAHRDLVFFTTWWPTMIIGCVASSGEDFREVRDVTNLYGTSGSDMVTAIEVDSARQRLYWVRFFRIWEMDYNGDIYRGISPQGAYNMFGLALDPQREVLYFNSRKTVMRYNLNTNTSAILVELDMIPRNIEYHDDVLYISGTRDYKVISYNLITRVVEKLFTVFERPLSICLLP